MSKHPHICIHANPARAEHPSITLKSMHT